MNSTARTAAIGIDVGGTDIKGGLVTSDSRVITKTTIATEVNKGVDHVIGRMIELIRKLDAEAKNGGYDVPAVGVGMPGTLSRRHGTIIAPPNLPGWRNIPLVERLEKAIPHRVFLDNDANLAAYGEYASGAGRGVRDMVMLTLGTGIGSGIILGGQLFRGEGENAGEFGHMIVQIDGRLCGCGQRGCMESYTSARHLIARVTEELQAGQSSSLKKTLEQNGKIEASDIARAAQAGDLLAKTVWEDACRYLAVGCMNIHAGIDPERIVFAGGMSNAGDFLLHQIHRFVAAMASDMLGEFPDLRIAELGNDAGFIGAAMHTFAG